MSSYVKTVVIPVCAFSLVVAGCAPLPPQKTAAEHQKELASNEAEQTTLGLFQSKIKEGMPQADVAIAVGSPNIVTQDAKGNDTWIYDKISTTTSYSNSNQSKGSSVGGGAALGVLGAVGALLGVGASQSQNEGSNAGASSQTQKTLTVVIKFDSQKKVSKIRYQTSSF